MADVLAFASIDLTRIMRVVVLEGTITALVSHVLAHGVASLLVTALVRAISNDIRAKASQG